MENKNPKATKDKYNTQPNTSSSLRANTDTMQTKSLMTWSLWPQKILTIQE